MRVTKLTLNSNDVEIASMSVRNLNRDDKYLIRGMVGLDADEIVSRFYGFGALENSKFHDQTLKPRDIVIRIALNPRWEINESFSNLRDDLYRMISATRDGRIQLKFYAGASIIAHIYGFVSKFEVPHFSKVSEVQLTFHCVDPIFRGINPTVLSGSELSSGFPLEIFDSKSTAPHGFDFNFTFDANASEFVIASSASTPDWEFEVTYAFLTGDILYFSSEYNNKKLYVDRSGAITQLVNAISPGSIWPIVFPGENEFYFTDVADFNFNQVSYYPSYWGV